MITHLLQRYGKITTSDLMNNRRKMDEPMENQSMCPLNALMNAYNLQQTLNQRAYQNKFYKRRITPLAPQTFIQTHVKNGGENPKRIKYGQILNIFLQANITI